MKKLVPFLALAALLISGCGKQNTSGSSSDSGAATSGASADKTGTGSVSTVDTTGTTTTTQTGTNATDPNAPKRP